MGFTISLLLVLIISAAAVQAQVCRRRDACTSTRELKAKVGGYVTDGCRRTYQFGNGCSLTRIQDLSRVPRVQGVLFVEKDQRYQTKHVRAVEQQLRNLQTKWYNEFGGTFALANPIVSVIRGDQNTNYYINTPDGIHGEQRWYRLGNIKNEVYRKLGIRNFDEHRRVVSYPIATSDGKVGGNFGGAWMDGDDLACILGERQSFPFRPGTAAHCLGHLAHEFGHVFGLQHTGPQSDCMQQGFYTSELRRDTCRFSNANRNSVRKTQSKWLTQMPGSVIG